MEHHLRWDQSQLPEVYDIHEHEVTLETEVVSVGCLVGGCLNMEDVIYVWMHETYLQMQVG